MLPVCKGRDELEKKNDSHDQSHSKEVAFRGSDSSAFHPKLTYKSPAIRRREKVWKKEASSGRNKTGILRKFIIRAEFSDTGYIFP